MDIKIALLIVAGLLAGCKSATVSAAFQNLADTTDTLAAQVNAGTVSDPLDMPSTGGATYSGSAAFGTSSDYATILANPELVSEVAISADFQANTVSGSFSNFEASSGKTVTGSLSLSNGAISDENYGADAVGILSVGGEDQAIDGVIFGQFFGAGQSLLGGGLAANRTTGSTTDTLYGTFGATKD